MDTDHSTQEASVNDPVDEIASLLMGGDDSGDDDSTTDDPSSEQTPDTEDTEDLEDAEEPSEESTEGDEEVDDESEETDETEDDDKTLAQMLGVEENQLSVLDDGGFMINVKVDGEQSKHSLADVIKNYQLESSNTNKSKALADDRKQFEQIAATKVQEVNQALERNQSLAQVLEQEIMSDYEKVDWDDLRQYDPAEWTAKRQEYATKYNKIQRLQQELEGQATQTQQDADKKTTEQQQVYLKAQWDQMIVNNPSWSNTSKYEKDMDTLKSFASDTYGFSDQDFLQVADARLIELIKDAQSYRKGSKIAQQKIKTIPKKLKRGKGGRFTKNKVSKLDKLTQAAAKATGANKRDLQTSAVAELLMG